MDCTTVSINRIFCWELFPLLYQSFPCLALEKSRIARNTSGLKELLPSQIHHQGEKQESDFTAFVLIPDLLQHMALPPFSSLIFDSSILKTLTEVRFMQMDKHIWAAGSPASAWNQLAHLGMEGSSTEPRKVWACRERLGISLCPAFCILEPRKAPKICSRH